MKRIQRQKLVKLSNNYANPSDQKGKYIIQVSEDPNNEDEDGQGTNDGNYSFKSPIIKGDTSSLNYKNTLTKEGSFDESAKKS